MLTVFHHAGGGLRSWSRLDTCLTITVLESDITQMMEMIMAFQVQQQSHWLIGAAYGWRFEVDLGLTIGTAAVASLTLPMLPHFS